MRGNNRQCTNKKVGKFMIKFAKGKIRDADLMDRCEKHLFKCDRCFRKYVLELEKTKTLR